MASLTARLIKRGTRVLIKRNTVQDKHALVKHLRRAFAPPPFSLIPPGVRLARFQHGALRGDWLQVDCPREVVLYLHGGGYVAGSPKTYHSLCAGLAKQLQADVYLPKYRLAPEHPFPAPVEDGVAAYDMLLAKGYKPQQITLMGDSAGGGLSLATLLSLRDTGRPLPKCAVVYSPFADMTRSAPSQIRNNDSDAMLSAGMLGMADDLYCRLLGDMTHPYASPVYGDFQGLPPLLITVCEEECLRDDSYQVAQRAQEAGVPVTFISRQDLFHVWPVMYPLLPEAREDLKKVLRFIRSH